MTTPTRRGFTLIELLVVVSVIGLLAAIALPVTARLRGAARKTQCVSNLDQLGDAVILYTDENAHWYPCAACLPSAEPEDGLPRVCDLLSPYASGGVFRCPDDQPIDPEYPFRSYFEGEGSSYEWSGILNGLKVGQQHEFIPIKVEVIPILRDYEPFHRHAGGKVGINGLFSDTHVESF